MQSKNKVPAVFLDRDGVLIKDKGYLHTAKDIVWMPGIISLLRHLQKLGYLLIVVSNQSGIGRRLYTRKDAEKVHAHLRAKLDQKGITLTDIYYCPHLPEDTCDCRKPKPGMLLQAAKKYGIALARSYMIGDKPSDIEAGKRVNCKTIFIGTKPGRSSLEAPQHRVKNLRDVIAIVQK